MSKFEKKISEEFKLEIKEHFNDVSETFNGFRECSDLSGISGRQHLSCRHHITAEN